MVPVLLLIVEHILVAGEEVQIPERILTLRRAMMILLKIIFLRK